MSRIHGGSERSISSSDSLCSLPLAPSVLRTCPPYDRESLVNFWADLSLSAKRALLRIDEDAYIAALEKFLLRHSLCCECHDNVIAEWEDHKRQRSGNRSLRHVFTMEYPLGETTSSHKEFRKSQVAIREDNADFILDLIHCGEEFSYVTPYRPVVGDGGESEEDSECPGANTSHLAQEYLLEVLSIKFREQIENSYQVALQHSLEIQAQLLEDEIASMKIAEMKAATKRKKKKEKKKKRKKKLSESSNSVDLNMTFLEKDQVVDLECHYSKEEDPIELDIEVQIDREVEDFRLLLERISKSSNGSRTKLVLPPGTFSHQAQGATVYRHNSTLQAA